MRALLLALSFTLSTSTPIIASIDGPATAYAPAVRLFQTRPALDAGVIVDATGDALGLLTETYTAHELAAGGQVTITFSPGLANTAMVPYQPNDYPECLGAPRCILINEHDWKARPYDGDRVMIDHEFAHVLSFRYQAQMYDFELAKWQPRHDRVNEECLADSVASLVLARGSFPPNETPAYTVHYMCDVYWQQRFGTDLSSESKALAEELLRWAGEIA